MKFVALLSGGKDSCYNIEKCISHGHVLECVANLHPSPIDGVDEVNSYMYQSAAYNAIPFLAECFGVPLIRRALSGTAVLQSLDYEVTVSDEVEDLYELLRQVKQEYPDIIGVSCGTIVSSYQRFRVENVCERLNLVPLTYLWQRNRVELLSDMIAAGVDAILVKVAGAGLVPDKHLGKSLAQLEPTFHRLHERFELDVCGEGGEYESLVLDCSCFKKRLEITASEIVYDDEDPSVGSLKILSCAVRDKTPIGQDKGRDDGQDKCTSLGGVAMPKPVSGNISATVASARSLPSNVDELSSHRATYTHIPLVFDMEGFCQSSLLTCPSTSQYSTAVAQLNYIFRVLTRALQLHNVCLADVVFTHLYLSDMSLFEAINEEYCRRFSYRPPSRSCISVPLPGGMYVAMSVTLLAASYADMKRRVSDSMARREVLHVRSLSEWAPLCIGPYAQANIVNHSLAFIAGQIGLYPATMQMIADVDKPSHQNMRIPDYAGRTDNMLLPAHLYYELYQSLLNADKVLLAVDTTGGGLGSAVVCTIYTVASDVLLSTRNETDVYLYAHIETCVRTLLAEICRNHPSWKINCSGGDDMPTSESDDESLSTSEVACVTKTHAGIPVAVVGVLELPRGAVVEVEVVGAMTSTLSCGVSYKDFHWEEVVPAEFDGIDTPGVVTSPLDEMRNMPIWSVAYKPYPTPLSAVPAVNPLVNASSLFETRVQYSHCDTALCCGFVSINARCQPSCPSVANYEHNDAPASCSLIDFMDLSNVATELCFSLADIVRRTCMEKTDLRSLKIFYNVGDMNGMDVGAAISLALCKICRIDHIVPQLIPSYYSGSSTTFLVAQFFFVNFIQMKTELWIRNR